MKRVLPGGATLDESDLGDGVQTVVCRPGVAVLERTKPVGICTKLRQAINTMVQGINTGQLHAIKLVLEIGVALVALIGGIIALVWGSR